jgi:hypothetical protein
MTTDTTKHKLKLIKAQKEKQVQTTLVRVEDVMRSEAFRQGVADARAGRPPRYDGAFELMPLDETSLPSLIRWQWNYERGRTYAVLAPRTLRVVSPRSRELNPEAVRFYRRFGDVL